jgi:hypothetical protein
MTRKPLRLLVLAVTLAALMTAVSAPAVSAHRPVHPRVVEAAKCLHGGYQDYTRADGKPFRTVAHCVVYALLGGKLKPAFQVSIAYATQVGSFFEATVTWTGVEPNSDMHISFVYANGTTVIGLGWDSASGAGQRGGIVATCGGGAAELSDVEVGVIPAGGSSQIVSVPLPDATVCP